MSIPTVYIKCKSKAEANRILANGGKLIGTIHNPWNTYTITLPDDDHLADGAVIKFYDRVIDGNPYAKSYGNWNARKKRFK